MKDSGITQHIVNIRNSGSAGRALSCCWGGVRLLTKALAVELAQLDTDKSKLGIRVCWYRYGSRRIASGS